MQGAVNFDTIEGSARSSLHRRELPVRLRKTPARAVTAIARPDPRHEAGSSRRCAARVRSPAAPRPAQTRPSEDERYADQEQIQIIANAIGTPKASAPNIAGTNSESRLMWSRTPDDDMTLLLGAPRALARPQDERSISRLRTVVHGDSVERQCWGVMVNKRLMSGDSSTASFRTLASSWIVRVSAGNAI